MQNDTGTDSSYLANPVVIAICLVLCVISAILGASYVALFLGFVFILTLIAYLWARYSLKNLSYKIKVNNQFIYPGQQFVVKRSFNNGKMLPLIWLEISESCNISDCAMPSEEYIVTREDRVADNTITIQERLYTLSFIKWHQKVSFKDPWEAKRRGIMQIKSSTLKSGDGFGLCAKTKVFEFDVPYRITVFPQLLDVSIGKIINDIWDSRSASHGYLHDKTIIKSIRDYIPSDSAKEINMRLLAKGGDLKTNLYEIVTPDSVLFILDSKSFEMSSKEQFEEALSILASLIDGLCEYGVAVSLYTPKSEWFPEDMTEASNSEHAKYLMLERLAAAEPTDEVFSSNILANAQESMQVYYVSSTIENATSLNVLDQFPEHKTKCLVLQDTRLGESQNNVRMLDLMSMKRSS